MQEMILTPEELFFLGKMRKAKYLDYGYIQAMKDVRKNAGKAREEAGWALVEKGYAEEDFLGNITLLPEVEALTDPVFFGEFESNITLCTMGKPNIQQIWRLHFQDGKGVLSVFREDGIHLTPLSEEVLRGLIVSLLPEGAFDRELPKSLEVKKEGIHRLIAFKNNYIGQRAEVKVFFEYDGYICCEMGDHTDLIAPADFCNEGYRILKGE